MDTADESVRALAGHFRTGVTPRNPSIFLLTKPRCAAPDYLLGSIKKHVENSIT